MEFIKEFWCQLKEGNQVCWCIVFMLFTFLLSIAPTSPMDPYLATIIPGLAAGLIFFAIARIAGQVQVVSDVLKILAVIMIIIIFCAFIILEGPTYLLFMIIGYACFFGGFVVGCLADMVVGVFRSEQGEDE